MSIYQFTAENINGGDISLEEYRGKVLLIVNTASQCGFTSQYGELRELQNKYGEKNFTVLAFPCNQFGGQEPGSNEEIVCFALMTYEVNFPMFAKVEVNGDNAHPLFKYLKEAAPGLAGTKAIKWNFTKFLVDKNGIPLKRFAPTRTPLQIAQEIEKHLD